MQLKTARLTILITPAMKEAFEAHCRSHDATASQVVRRLIREYMEQQSSDRVLPALKPAMARRAS